MWATQIEEDLRKAPDAKVPLEEYYNGFHSISADDFEKFAGESKLNEEDEKIKENYKGFTFYRDNPDLSVHEVVQMIFDVCEVK